MDCAGLAAESVAFGLLHGIGNAKGVESGMFFGVVKLRDTKGPISGIRALKDSSRMDSSRLLDESALDEPPSPRGRGGTEGRWQPALAARG